MARLGVVESSTSAGLPRGRPLSGRELLIGQLAQSPDTGRRRGAALSTSAVVTLATAVGLDALAGERPIHTGALGAVALIVSAARILYAGRHRGLFAAASLVVLAQPAAHAAAKVVHLGASSEHVRFGSWSADLSPAAVHVLFALLAVVVSTSELALEVLGTTLTQGIGRLTALLGTNPPPPSRTIVAAARSRAPTSPTYRPFVSRRGPPLLEGTVG